MVTLNSSFIMHLFWLYIHKKELTLATTLDKWALIWYYNLIIRLYICVYWRVRFVHVFFLCIVYDYVFLLCWHKGTSVSFKLDVITVLDITGSPIGHLSFVRVWGLSQERWQTMLWCHKARLYWKYTIYTIKIFGIIALFGVILEANI